MAPDTYLKPHLLDPQLHRQYRLKPIAHYRFASHMLSAPLGLSEVVPLSRSCPVVIVEKENGGHTFAVVMGFEEGENLLLDAEGRWRGGAHIPAFLRRYPFIPIEHSDDTENFAIGVDVACQEFNTAEGEPLFDQYGGGKTPTLERIIDLLRAFHLEVNQGARLCRELVDAGLLERRSAVIRLEDDDADKRLEGFMVVNEEKLRAQPDDVLANWTRSGALAIILAHLQSLDNLQALLPLRGQ